MSGFTTAISAIETILIVVACIVGTLCNGLFAGLLAGAVAEFVGKPDVTEAVLAGFITAVLGHLVAAMGVCEYFRRRLLDLELDLYILGQLLKEMDLLLEEVQGWAQSFDTVLSLGEKLQTIGVFLTRKYDSERSALPAPSVDLFNEGLELWRLVRLNLKAFQQTVRDVTNLINSLLFYYKEFSQLTVSGAKNFGPDLERTERFVTICRAEMMTGRGEVEKAMAILGRSVDQLETALPRLELELGMREDEGSVTLSDSCL